MRKRPCNWFDREGALRIERGEDPHPHLDECPTCREAHDEYLGLVELLPFAHAESGEQARDLARRVRLAIAAALAALLCFFTGRRAAFAASSGGAAATNRLLFAQGVTIGLALGASGLLACGLSQRDSVEHPPFTSSVQSAQVLAIVEAPAETTTPRTTPVSPAPAATERPTPRMAAVAVKKASAPASLAIPPQPSSAAPQAAHSRSAVVQSMIFRGLMH